MNNPYTDWRGPAPLVNLEQQGKYPTTGESRTTWRSVIRGILFAAFGIAVLALAMVHGLGK